MIKFLALAVVLVAVEAIEPYGQQQYAQAGGHEQDYYTEPHYSFVYEVKDLHTHDIKSHKEERKGDHTQGVYELIEPDGSKRIVHYTVEGKSGFNAVVHREHSKHPISAGKGGYGGAEGYGSLGGGSSGGYSSGGYSSGGEGASSYSSLSTKGSLGGQSGGYGGLRGSSLEGYSSGGEGASSYSSLSTKGSLGGQSGGYGGLRGSSLGGYSSGGEGASSYSSLSSKGSLGGQLGGGYGGLEGSSLGGYSSRGEGASSYSSLSSKGSLGGQSGGYGGLSGGLKLSEGLNYASLESGSSNLGGGYKSSQSSYGGNQLSSSYGGNRAGGYGGDATSSVKINTHGAHIESLTHHIIPEKRHY